MRKGLFGVTVALALSGVAPLFAQGIEIEPYVGVYIPTQDLVDQVPGGAFTELLQASQKEGLAVGGRVTVWLAMLGLEGNVLYAFSDAQTSVDGDADPDESAAVWTADGRLVLKLLPGPVSVHIGGGVALISRTGDFYDEVSDGTSNVGGVAGLGVRVKLPGVLALRADADGYFYSSQLTADLDGTPVEFDSATQFDLVLSAGLVFSLGL